MRAPLSGVKEVRKIDDLTVEFETFVPDPIFLQEQTNLLIMSKAWCEAHNSTEPVTIGKADNYALHNAMGTGPFTQVSREPDRKTVVEKNPLWWDKPEHNVDRVEFNVIASAPTRVAALLSGEMDMIYTVPPQDIARIKQTEGLKILQTPGVADDLSRLRPEQGELPSSNIKARTVKDVRVRQAVALAIDEPAIASRVMLGLGHPTAEMWGPGVNGYDAALDVRPQVDPVKAKQLLTEAGYPDGFQVAMDCPNDRYVMDEQDLYRDRLDAGTRRHQGDLNAQTKSKFFHQDR